MRWLKAQTARTLAFHNDRLEQHYGHDHSHYFQIRVLATITLAVSLLMMLFLIGFSVIDTSLLAAQTKLVFSPIVAAVVVPFALSYRALMEGRDLWARRIVAVTVLAAVLTAVALTGGFPGSVANPVLLLPTLIFFCLFGARAGIGMAILMPACAAAMFLATKVLGFEFPDYTSRASPELNVGLLMITVHLLVALVISAYETNNRRLASHLDVEIAKHAQLANQDALTGLGNARYFDQELKRQLAAPLVDGKPLTLIVCDLDSFKPINDSFGHPVGDQVLAAVGKRLGALTKHGVDVAARIGGDEFAVILLNCAPADLPAVCARIRTAVTAPIALRSGTFRVGISLGWAHASPGCRAPIELMKQADDAMYRDKKRERSNA